MVETGAGDKMTESADGAVISGCLEKTSMRKHHMSRELNEVGVSSVMVWKKKIVREETAGAQALTAMGA